MIRFVTSLAAHLVALVSILVAPQSVAAQAEQAETVDVSQAATAETSEVVSQASVEAALEEAMEEANEGSDEAPPLIASEVFAGRNSFFSAHLSPDGQTMVVLQMIDEGKTLQMTTVDTATSETVDGINFKTNNLIQWVEWIDNDRVLVNVLGFAGTVNGYPLIVTRLLIAYPKTGKFDFLVKDSPRRFAGRVLHITEDGRQAIIAHRGDGRLNTPSVFRYQLEPGGAVNKIVEPKLGVTSWITDDSGTVRLGLGWRRGKVQIFYRDSAQDDFERVARFKPNETEKYFDALQIIRGSSEGYVLDEGEDGRVGLRTFDYATREITGTFYEHPEWDIESAWLKDGKPLAAVYTDDRQQIVWFDDSYKADYEALGEAIGDREIVVTSRSEDGKKMLVRAGNEADPGTLYFYDAEVGELKEMKRYRPKVDFRQLARPKPVSYTARDGTEIRAYLTLPKGRDPHNLPLILHPHGGPFGIRDELRYDDHVQFLANRGYAVLQPNFRGSGGYGSDFYDLGSGEVGRGMQDDLDDAMDWAVAQGIADPARVCIVGGSYGGYAALWGVLRNPERYACAASWAGVTDWTKMLKYDRRVLSRQAGKRWSAKIEGDEDLDLKDVSPYRLAKELKRPVLLAHGTRDSNVPFAQYEIMVKAAKKATVPLETLVIEGEGHSFSKKNSEEKWFDALDGFLEKHNPADPEARQQGEAQTASSSQ